LYNLETDTGEKCNLAGEHPEIIKHLTEMMPEFDRDLRRNRRTAGQV
jgi:hypothetical protein